jgi:hypothetical protein
MATPLAVFGPGVVIVTRTDVSPSPAVNVGYAQELSLDASGTTKNLFGQNQYPLVSARGTVKVTGKVKAAVVSGIAFNNIFFGNSFTVGGDNYYIGEPHTPTGTPPVATMTHVTGGIVDLGVTYQASGLPLVRVAAGSEALGKYSLVATTGIYTFATGDTTPMLFTYSNFASTGSGQQLNVTNQPIGFTPTFQLDYWVNLNQPGPKPFSIRVFACVASKLAMAGKLEDYMMPEFDFDAFANNAGQVFNFNFPEVS